MGKYTSIGLLLSLLICNAIALDICEEQLDGTRLQHPLDCTKFIICNKDTIAAISSCPSGLHFNRHLGVCDLQSRAGCKLIDHQSTDDTTCDCSCCCSCCNNCPPTDTTLAPPTPVTTEAPITTIAPPTPVTTEAPITTIAPSTPDTTVAPSSPTVVPTTPPVTPSTPVTPEVPSGSCANDLDICVGVSDNSVQIYPNNCNQYVVCENECAIVMRCPNNLQYNLATNRCDYPENVDCPYESTPPSGPEAGPSGTSCIENGVCAGQPDGTLFSDSTSSGYIVCQCECEIPRSCPPGLIFNITAGVCDWPTVNGSDTILCPDGLVYNATAGYCDWPSDYDHNTGNVNVTCANNSNVCKNQPEGTLFPVDGICNAFYKCNFGCAVEIICPNNLIYNPDLLACDNRLNYDCPWPYTPPSGPNAGPSGIACPSGGRCVNQPDGYLLPSTTSCGQYVICQCECEVSMDCPADLQWDTNLQTCNYASNVNCTL